MIKENVAQLMAEVPAGVQIVAVAKGRTVDEIMEAIEAGIKIIGENYLSEAKAAYRIIGRKAAWHFVGTFQKHNIRQNVLGIFDMVETVHSWEIAETIDRKCAQIGKIMPVLVEVNIGREPQKSGVPPEQVEPLVKRMCSLGNIRVMGLMTLEPCFRDPEDSRPYFVETRRIFERLKELQLPNVEMRYLSMGMSDSFRIAVQEGANLIRIGTRIFGPRRGD
jgi:pyridoxal phosphate enzyme (YggS family)